jgi:hypothetical protein
MDSNSPSVCWWAILTILEAELGSPQIIELVASCLIFPTTQISLKLITPDIVNNLSRGQRVTVQKMDSNSPNVCWWAILTILNAKLGSPQT